MTMIKVKIGDGEDSTTQFINTEYITGVAVLSDENAVVITTLEPSGLQQFPQAKIEGYTYKLYGQQAARVAVYFNQNCVDLTVNYD